MRYFVIAALLTTFPTLPALAGAKANTLTPKQIADGWLLLFDGETTFGWAPGDESKWTVADGTLRSPAGKEAVGTFATTAAFGDYELELEYAAKSGAALMVGMGKKLPALEVTGVGVLQPQYASDPNAPARESVHALAPTADAKGEWSRLRLEVDGGYVRAWSQLTDGVTSSGTGSIGKDSPRHPGRIAIAGKDLKLRSIKLRPLGTKALFNGKDLTGWKVFPGKKSKVDVEQGTIHLVNGPGDLQTEGKYADFVLQLECKVNGKHLNSGVFFRCKPNEYQNGYEAQIHNNFTADPPKAYTVEDFNPVTNVPIGKKAVKSAATDFGTGAIYRRVPARKAMAKDGEWFTMTVVAHGKHFATWVNGVQQVDWTDNRPANDNPRNGYRAEAGHLSIQGHDPTTDLSFRNLRIAELSAAK